ncbi:glycosyltransferase [Synechococcus sp. RSCCF101]|uniref:TIGR04283 family arsenosugar biosynthesis glycosyltransferase n=1 Tax=Synechococcus sp. RSCCF101 TaxID=2511069 RepID=UPI001244B2D5|nr:TIGR04283 family arsenosugar biosynthesis glycosyltransferase [Synechococcus sp. RSCCF101]QEY31630.1 glycosyltransferase [Synechococcus sp. RSCCF101]
MSADAPERMSVIIPTLDEEDCLARTLRSVQALDPPAWEVLVVDGGSRDGTIRIAEAAGATVLRCARAGRGVQMNAGARAASGTLLCFLHADTLIPPDLTRLAARTLSDHSIACAGFISVMRTGGRVCWVVTAMNLLKTHLAPLLFRPLAFCRGLRLLFGDQVMVLRRETFWADGGFDERLTLLEDGDLCLRIVNQGRLTLIPRLVESSGRRVRAWGSFRAITTYLSIGILWGLGVAPERMRRFYEDVR